MEHNPKKPQDIKDHNAMIASQKEIILQHERAQLPPYPVKHEHKKKQGKHKGS